MKRNLLIALCVLAFTSLQAQNVRERLNFDSDWQFAFGDASDPAKDFGCGTESTTLQRLPPSTMKVLM